MELTKEIVMSLLSDDIKHKDYLDIINDIAYQVDEIWSYIIKASGRELKWWGFSNGGGDGGNFDPGIDMEEIYLTGEWSMSKLKLREFEYEEGFPTEFLWCDYKPIVDAHIEKAKKAAEEYKSQKKVNREQLKEKRRKLIAQIKSKLTPEELRIVKFKEI